jgi:hypothetical protein
MMNGDYRLPGNRNEYTNNAANNYMTSFTKIIFSGLLS